MSKTDWERLKNMKDEDIDFSDIPETNEDFWKDAEVIVPIKKKVDVTITVDEDIADWLSELGAKSNKAVNSLLHAYFITIKSLNK